MILRTVSAIVPPILPPLPGSEEPRRIIGWQLDAALRPSGPWRPVNGGTVVSPSGELELMAGRFGTHEAFVRVTFVAEGGSYQGGALTQPPARLAGDGATTELGARPRGAGRIRR